MGVLPSSSWTAERDAWGSEKLGDVAKATAGYGGPGCQPGPVACGREPSHCPVAFGDCVQSDSVAPPGWEAAGAAGRVAEFPEEEVPVFVERGCELVCPGCPPECQSRGCSWGGREAPSRPTRPLPHCHCCPPIAHLSQGGGLRRSGVFTSARVSARHQEGKTPGGSVTPCLTGTPPRSGCLGASVTFLHSLLSNRALNSGFTRHCQAPDGPRRSRAAVGVGPGARQGQ